jgi:predicted transcriptional regulator
MEVHFTPEQEAQLAQIATNEGTEPERLVKDAALRLLQEDARFRAAVREGIAQADRGEFIEEDEMDARLEQQFEAKLAALRTVIDQGDASGQLREILSNVFGGLLSFPRKRARTLSCLSGEAPTLRTHAVLRHCFGPGEAL